MIHSDGEDVWCIAEFQVRREVAFESGVAVGAAANEVAVDPDFGVVVDTFEFDGDEFGFGDWIEIKGFAIPADASRREAGATGVFRAERALDAPIVREIQHAPTGIIEARHHAGGEIAFAEFPVAVEIHDGSGSGCGGD